jgi:ribosome-binding ATPase YchF (GTP1/OBG family)
MWVYTLIKKDWDKALKNIGVSKKKITSLLEDRLSGLSINKNQITDALHKIGLNQENPNSWSESNILRFVHELRMIAKPILLAANKADIPESEKNIEKLKETNNLVIPCCAEAELALRRAVEKDLITYLPGDSSFTVKKGIFLSEEQQEGLNQVKEKVLERWSSSGIQNILNAAFFNLLKMISVYPVQNPERFSDHEGRVLPEVYLVPEGTTAKQFASLIHTELGKGFLYAIETRKKMRVGDDYILKDRDVISIVSTKTRG